MCSLAKEKVHVDFSYTVHFIKKIQKFFVDAELCQ